MKKPNLDTSDLTINRKALLINLDNSVYGTFAEIGAGQEVARHFFKSGGASGTIAKSMSAYDMKFSDEIYGKSSRYVSKERLIQMLDHEYSLLNDRLAEERGENTTFFVFANTVAAASYSNRKPGNGWLGIRYQIKPNTPPNDIKLHINMLDKTNLAQQDALGIVGVNLIFGAMIYYDDPQRFIQSLLDHLTPERIEIDMLEFSGPDFEDTDNRILSLQLVQEGLTNAVMFGPNQTVLQPSSELRKKAVLVERGSFRPITHVNLDMLKCAGAQFVQEEQIKDNEIVVLLEITINNLLQSGNIDLDDFLARIDTISALGYHVLISNYMEYFRLSAYFRRYTDEMIGLVMGINHLQAIFIEDYYSNLDGGILEAFGRLFKQNVKAYIYPMQGRGYEKLAKKIQSEESSTSKNTLTEEIVISADNLKVEKHLAHLYAHLLENHFIEPVIGADKKHLQIYSREILSKIQNGESGWEDGVPEAVAELIKERGFWNHKK